MMRLLVLAACLFQATTAFAPTASRHLTSPSCQFMTRESDNTNESRRPSFNPLREAVDMFSNMDAVVDDFFNKRMGNGEIFYGKRKYKPSGNVETEYNGFGLTDRRKIDIARARKEQYLEEKRQREEEAQK